MIFSGATGRDGENVAERPSETVEVPVTAPSSEVSSSRAVLGPALLGLPGRALALLLLGVGPALLQLVGEAACPAAPTAPPAAS